MRTYGQRLAEPVDGSPGQPLGAAGVHGDAGKCSTLLRGRFIWTNARSCAFVVADSEPEDPHEARHQNAVSANKFIVAVEDVLVVRCCCTLFGGFELCSCS
jgi:hypothetical protein